MIRGEVGGIGKDMESHADVSHEYRWKDSMECRERGYVREDDEAGKLPFPHGGVRDCDMGIKEKRFKHTKKDLGMGRWWVIKWEVPTSTSTSTSYGLWFRRINEVEDPVLLFVSPEAFAVASHCYTKASGSVPGWIDFEKDVFFFDAKSFVCRSGEDLHSMEFYPLSWYPGKLQNIMNIKRNLQASEE